MSNRIDECASPKQTVSNVKGEARIRKSVIGIGFLSIRGASVRWSSSEETIEAPVSG